MNKNTLILSLTLLLLAGGSVAAARYLAWWPSSKSPLNQTAKVADAVLLGQPEEVVPWTVETVASSLEIPWSVVFTGSDRILVTERPGRIRQIVNGQLSPEPLHTFDEVSSRSEEGLMGLAVDPEYDQNQWLYASLAYQKGDRLVVKVLRLKDLGSSVSEISTLLDGIPAAANHAGNRLRFGPDGKLYITTGDATDRALAQDLNSLAGKILRMNSDGSIPSDNPFPNSLVFSYGHRNPQGLDWHPVTKQLFSTEHGPTLFDGPAGGDEINLIEAGQNYGWPLVSHTKTQAGTVAPLQLYTPAEAPASGTFYGGSTFPQFSNNFFFGALKGDGLVRLVLDADDPRQILSQEKLFTKTFGRIREVTVGPDGLIYFVTSNRDGRGTAQAGDDHLYRLSPQ